MPWKIFATLLFEYMTPPPARPAGHPLNSPHYKIMKISIETGSYNERRYGKPYIAVLNSTDATVNRWGTWIGTPGSEGILEIEAAPGDVIMKGQKDNRGNNGTPDYAIIREDGSREYMSKAAAIKASREMQAEKKPVANQESLREERQKLLERIAEIDAILAAA
jgi:hypothetical protein